ncbi:MAG: class I SAM-dependent methyltransferase [Aquificae bacterium]|nr:class I SAM-dependent methyltransferase [Aquificota bacterium]
MSPFDRLALRYDLWYEKPFGKSAFELESRCLQKLTGEFRRGLEVGVGTGRFAQKLGVEFGIDPSLEMLKIARSRGVKVVQGIGESLPFRENSFDLVLIVVSICFVKDPFGVIKEARRVLEKGGKLLLGLIPRDSRWSSFYLQKAREGHPIYREAKFYPLVEIRKMLKEAGFEEKRTLSTLVEDPQDEKPVSSKEVREGFDPLAGFTCILAT